LPSAEPDTLINAKLARQMVQLGPPDWIDYQSKSQTKTWPSAFTFVVGQLAGSSIKI
jgi:hypothetical protein